jgi:hypothetical protein
LAPAVAHIIAGYLAELESHLPAGRRARREILLEIADGLGCAVAERTEQGQSVEEAARTAMAAFGDSRTVAAAFTRQLGPRAAHRLGAGLVLTGPLVGLTWVVSYATAGQDWSSQILDVLSAMPQYPLILAVTVPAAMIATTGAGWAARHLDVPPRVVTGAAIVAAVGCVAGDLSLLVAAMLSHNLTATSLTALAMAASVVRLSAAGWAGRRIALLRAGVH